MAAQAAIQSLRKQFAIPEGELANDDASVMLQSLLVAASQAKEPDQHLALFREAVDSPEVLSELDVFSAVPTLLSLSYPSVAGLLDLISRESSAKELVIIVQEQISRLQNLNQDDEDQNTNSETSVGGQTLRLLKIYTLAVPRLRKGKRAPKDILDPILSQIIDLFSSSAHDYTSEEAQDIVSQVLMLAQAIAPWAAEHPEPSTETLYKLISDTLEVLADRVNADVEQRAFQTEFPRLVMPNQTRPSGKDVAQNAWTVLHDLGIPEARIASTPTLANLILLAHAPATPAVSTLATFLPVLLTSIQTNTALGATLALLLRTLGPLQRTGGDTADGTLAPDVALPLAHVLAPLSAAHPSPRTRHIAFRTLALVLACAPAPARMAALHELLGDADAPAPLRVAAVGLVKDAVLGSLARSAPSPFAGPAFLQGLAPLLFRADLPDAADPEEGLERFLESPEPKRLVEVLGLLFLLLQRDTENRIGLRARDTLRSIRKSLLTPVKEHLDVWSQVDLEGSDEVGMQMQILDMWVQRVLDAIEDVEREL